MYLLQLDIVTRLFQSLLMPDCWYGKQLSRLHAYANGACSYTIFSYAVISKYVQYTSLRYIAPYDWQRNKSYDNINFLI